MELALARYRLLFKYPFGTAHGLRDGTDAVFVRLTQDGVHGYGEAALPPYLKYDQNAVIQDIISFYLNHKFDIEHDTLDLASLDALCPPARAAFHVAYIDLNNSQLSRCIGSEFVALRDSPMAQSMVTLGHSEVDDIELKLSELPNAAILKVKLGAPNDMDVIRRLKELDARKLFLDANQGWTEIGQAEAALHAVGVDRVIGLEQPFAKDRWDLHKALKDRSGVPVYGDESIQGPEDLERAPEAFDGVNLKLMKCGGLDVAAQMAARARELGLKVMLGSMSESSLGCGAMLALGGMAELLDLDGPWLIRNDPFQGLRMEQGQLVLDGAAGIGVEPRSGFPLEFDPIGA
ncbi:MAG: hypothetical protein KF797_07390 [Flavobacteriales bacterium]|nr:hypothetical protein [Flavobacteriales bacterium]